MRSPRSRSAAPACRPLSVAEALQALHDDVAQDLFVAQAALTQLNAMFPDGQPEGRLARLAQEAVRRALTRVCDLVSGLRAADEASEADLAAALQRALLDVAAPMGIAISYGETGSGGYPPSDANASIVGIVREALANVREHAAASEVRVSVRRNVRSTRIVVADNGRGLEASDDADAAGSPHHAGYGLAEMQLRARALGGHVGLESKPGGGTTLIIDVPPERAALHGD